MGVLKLSITSARTTAYLTGLLEAVGGKHSIAQRITNYINALQSGSELAQDATHPPSIAIAVQGNQVQAHGTITFSAHATANDTIVINGVTFTCVASGATGNQWNVGTTATEDATNLTAAINGSVTALVSGYVTATSALGVITVTSAFYGLAGNQCTTAEGVDSGNVISVSGARLISGAEDATAQTLSF